MKLVTKNKWLFFLPFLFTPAKGEMAINAVGLSTPWPIALVSTLISFIWMKRAENLQTRNKAVSFNSLVWIVTIISFIRCLTSLVGSINSLRVYGLSGFQYPELACLIPFNISASLWQLKVMGEQQVEDNVESLERTERRVKFLKKVSVYLTYVTTLWTIVSLGIYASQRNFAANAWFITDCSQLPNTPSDTIVQCTPQNDGFSCLIGNRSVWIVDLFVRSFSIFPLFSFVLCLHQERREDLEGSSLIKSAGTGLTIVIFLTLLIFQFGKTYVDIVWLGSGIEKVCSVNKTLLHSYTGYLQEWWQQETVALKQISLV
jgi:hypothetical protein